MSLGWLILGEGRGREGRGRGEGGLFSDGNSYFTNLKVSGWDIVFLGA